MTRTRTKDPKPPSQPVIPWQDAATDADRKQLMKAAGSAGTLRVDMGFDGDELPRVVLRQALSHLVENGRGLRLPLNRAGCEELVGRQYDANHVTVLANIQARQTGDLE